MNINSIGTLFIVATPIGNLQDISARAIDTLKKVDWIAAEDTRHSLPLLQHLGVNTPLISLHEHNERERTTQLLELLQKGQSIALISDAGTPLISDPGYYLVREVLAAGISVSPIPGPNAAIAALSAAGLPTDRFIFEGFLSAKSKARKDQLKMLQFETRTLIFYEAPHRIMDLLEDIQEIFGDKRKAVIARELTKKFETIHADFIGELVKWVKQDANQERGEIVVIVEGQKELKQSEQSIPSEKILQELLTALPLKKAVELTAKITDEKKNDLYQKALQIKSNK